MIPKVPGAVVEYIRAMPAVDRVAIDIVFCQNDGDEGRELSWRIDEYGVVGSLWRASISGNRRADSAVRAMRGDADGATVRIAILDAVRDAEKRAGDSVAFYEGRPQRNSDADKYAMDRYRNCARVARELLAAVEAAWPEDAP